MKRLTPKEEEIMQVIWKLDKAFVKEILWEMAEPKPPITTVSSIVRKLEKEGMLSHESLGKTHRYYALVDKETYRKSSFSQFIDNYFGGSMEQVLSYFVKEDKIDPKELDELLAKIKEKQNKHD